MTKYIFWLLLVIMVKIILYKHILMMMNNVDRNV